MPDNPLEAVHNLVGISLPSGWKIVSKRVPEPSDTGGCFSVCYYVENARKQVAFLKALNLAKVLAMPGDQLRNIQNLIAAFNFERDALDICAEYRLRRVAVALEHGKFDIPGNPFGVYYIIFEKADGDIRKQLRTMESVTLAWTLRSLHQSAVGLWQLHRKRIAHQDVKPSNILFYGATGAKVSDLGCADIEGMQSPRGVFLIAGDPSYAPPELCYGEIAHDWARRRLGTDLYLFGSLITFVLVQVTMTSAVMLKLYPYHRPGLWPHGFRIALPYIRNAFGEVMEDIRRDLPAEIREEVASMIEQLCDPDPNLRGAPKYLNAQPYSMERYVSILNRLASKAELRIR